MSFSIYTTDIFDKKLKQLSKRYTSIRNDFKTLIESLKQTPIQGEPIGKDCYKIRMAISSKGKGKRAGSRVITCVKIEFEVIFLLTIYDKSDKATISEKELNDLLFAIK